MNETPTTDPLPVMLLHRRTPRDRGGRSARGWKSFALTGVLAAALAGCGTTVTNPVTGQAERTVMDARAEVDAGRQGHQEILKETPALANPALQSYVNEIGQRLAKHSHRADLTWTFTVLDSPDVNAFALPGGYIYVTRGILAYLDSEADLAGVIGHEIGHVTARHSAQRATRQQTAGLGALGGALLGVLLESRGISGAASALGQVSQGVAAGWVAKYSREQELQADKLGAEYLSRAGYDPTNMIDVIQMLKNQDAFAAERARAEGRQVPSGQDYLASHPSSDQRLADIRNIASAYQGRWGDDQRQRYLRAIDGVTFGDSRDAGVVRGTRFFHEPMGFAWGAPQGWTLQNSAEAVLAVAPSRDAAVALQTVPARGQTQEQTLRQAFGAVQGQAEPGTLNGFPATRFSGIAQDAQGRQQPLVVTLVDGPGGQRFALRLLAKDAAAQQRALPGLRETELALRALTDADRTAARPYTMRTVTLPAGGFAELARRSPLPPATAEAQLRLMNQAANHGQGPRAGELVKVVQ